MLAINIITAHIVNLKHDYIYECMNVCMYVTSTITSGVVLYDCMYHCTKKLYISKILHVSE